MLPGDVTLPGAFLDDLVTLPGVEETGRAALARAAGAAARSRWAADHP